MQRPSSGRLIRVGVAPCAGGGFIGSADDPSELNVDVTVTAVPI